MPKKPRNRILTKIGIERLKKAPKGKRVEYFDRKGELLKVSLLRRYQQLDRWWRPGEIEMTNVRTRKRSIVRWQKRQLKDDYTAADFESESLADGV